MDRQQYLLNMRQKRLLKGHSPCFVVLKLNQGKIYNDGTGYFIMSINDKELIFQRYTFFLNKLKPKDDFTIRINRLKSYKLVIKTIENILYFYDNEGNFIDIHYMKGGRDTLPTEENIHRIIRKLKELVNIKDDDGELDEQ